MSQEIKNQESVQVTPQPTVAFNIFVIQKELARRRRRHLRIAQTMLELTEVLVSSNASKFKSLERDDLDCLTSGVIYKKKLQRKLAKFCAWKKMQLDQKLKAVQECVKENCTPVTMQKESES